ncbi:putative 2-aminoethylphosphonate ABC transporter substrate-binding protein [Reyranella sp.]|uniref:putative 2-aminoethylphosphonate ABC transporter substrate-binding protein n=1 Tax=Reyranella sp. TaxID=1929291 RepID=UPI003D1082B0
MKSWLVAAVLLLAAVSASAQQRTRLLVYSTLEVANIGDFKKAFEAENPDIEIVWLRDSTGVLTAKILAEQNAQRGDAIWGLAVTSTMLLKERGLLEPYAPRNLTALKPSFRDPADPPSYVGMEGWVAAVCFNTVEGGKLGLPKPQSWFDLHDPRFKGKITMPHPASSGTGYFHVSAWIQTFGEEKAWAFMDRLHENIAMYVHSGAQPCRMTAAGEFPVGISAEISAAEVRHKGAPVEGLLMKEGGGWEMDTAAILKGTRNPEAARRLMDFAASRKANELYATFVSQVAMPGIASNIPDYPSGVAESMIKNDFAWASANRARILAEWARRYEGKTVKKN